MNLDPEDVVLLQQAFDGREETKITARRLFVALFVVAIVLLLVFCALLQNASASVIPCQGRMVDRDTMVKQLRLRHGEGQFGFLIVAPTALQEFFHNPLTRSYTILMTHPSGRSCIIDSGQMNSKLSSEESA